MSLKGTGDEVEEVFLVMTTPEGNIEFPGQEEVQKKTVGRGLKMFFAAEMPDKIVALKGSAVMEELLDLRAEYSQYRPHEVSLLIINEAEPTDVEMVDLADVEMSINPQGGSIKRALGQDSDDQPEEDEIVDYMVVFTPSKNNSLP